MIDLDFALSFAAHPGGISVTRFDEGTTTDGRYVDGEGTTTAGVEATVQPAPSEDVQLLPEGLRSKDAISIWSPYPFRPASQDGPPADQVTYQGKTFDVHVVGDRDAIGGYRKAVAVRVG